MNPNPLAYLIHKSSACGMGYRKDPLVGPLPPAGYVFPEKVSHLLEGKDSLPILPTLRTSED